jgi:SAM-dependent methyltransferase
MFHLATEGYTVHGIDRSPEMLNRARRRMAQRPDLRERCTVFEGDILTTKLPTKYGLIILPYNTFMHIHTGEEQRLAMERFQALLTEDGLLVIDIPNAGEQFGTQEDGAVHLERSFIEPESGNMVMQQSVSRIDRTTQMQYITWIYDEIDDSGALKRTVAPQVLRYVFPYEMDLLLEVAGLERVERYGDYDSAPFEGECPRMIIIASNA